MKNWAAALASIVLLAPVGAFAQTVEANNNFARDRNVSVRERPRPDYEAAGLHTGGFTVFPRLGVDVVADDNIYAAQNSKVADTIWRVKPEVAINSNWSQHSLSVFARVTASRYAKKSTEDTTDFVVGASGKLDVQRGADITGGATYSYLTEPRSAPTAPGAALKPVRYKLEQANLNGERVFNRLRFQAGVNVSNYDYNDPARLGGGTVFQQDRDRRETVENFRADYALSPATALFVTVAANQRDYRLSPPAVAIDRSSTGYETDIGSSFDITSLVRGEIRIGYLNQAYKARGVSDTSGFAAHAAVDYFPSQLTTIGFTASRTIEEATAAGASGYLSTNVGAKIDHELLRNVLLSASAGYGKDDYQGVDRTDTNKTAGLSGTYLLNRAVGLTVAYAYLDRSSTGTARNPSLTDNTVKASVTLQF